jgi:hypothetical protein
VSARLTKQELRIVLDAGATDALNMMVQALKSEIATVKIHPSHFVSFLVADFFQSHFEKDKQVLVAEFFDSDSYFDAARKKARGSDNYEEQMATALAEAQKIKSKRRRKATNAAASNHKTNEAVTP